MSEPTTFSYDDSSAAIAEAFSKRAQGYRVSVGRDVLSGKWKVRILGEFKGAAAQGA